MPRKEGPNFSLPGPILRYVSSDKLGGMKQCLSPTLKQEDGLLTAFPQSAGFWNLSVPQL